MTIGLTVKEHLDNKRHELYGRTVTYYGVTYILGEVSDNTATLYSEVGADQPDHIVDISLVEFI